MARRLIIGPGASSPFLVSDTGYDAATAGFVNLIFNGNQPPLRVWGTGYVTIAPSPAGNLAPAIYGTGVAVLATPSGLFPQFNVNTKRSQAGTTTPDRLRTVNSRPTQRAGCGATIFGNTLYPIQFDRKATDTTVMGNAVINYIIFKNYG